MRNKEGLTLFSSQEYKYLKLVVSLLATSVLILGLSACFKTNNTPIQQQKQTINNTNSLDTTNSNEDIDKWLIPLLSEYLADDTPPAPTCGDNTATHTGNLTLTTQAEVNAFLTNGVGKIDGDLILNPSANLNFSPLNLLQEITGDLRLGDNTNQTNLAGFDCLNKVDQLRITYNANLVSIAGFPSLVHGGLRIWENPKLTSTPSFPELTTMTFPDSIIIGKNDLLTSISEFPKLEYAGGLIIESNPRLTSIPSFPELSQINGLLSIRNNTLLTSITGFPKLMEIDGSLSISYNPKLDNIPSFPELSQIDRRLSITNNTLLTSIIGFPKLQNIGISNLSSIDSSDLIIRENPKLASIPIFPELTAIYTQGDLIIAENDVLTSITGFPKLETLGGANHFTSVASSIIIENNNLLSSITGFPQLMSINGNLNISMNAQLTNITGFDLFDSGDIGATSTVSDNPMLNCQNPDPNFAPVDVSTGNGTDCFTVAVVAFASIAPSGLFENYSYNSAGNLAVTNPDIGKFDVSFSGLTLDGDSNIQVSSRDISDNYCSLHDVSGDTAKVYCYDAFSDSLVDAGFTIAIVEQERAFVRSTAKITAYVVANNPTEASYTPATETSYNGYGNAITANRTGIGNYNVVFEDASISLFTNVQVTALDPAPGVFCTIGNWTGTTVNVKCFDPGGDAVDSIYSLMVIAKTPPANVSTKIVAYTRYNDFTNPSFNAGGGAVTVTNVGGSTSSGRTQIEYAGLDLTDNYHVQVTTRNSIHSDHFCVLDDTIVTNPSTININCYNHNSFPEYTQYNVLVVRK